MASVDEKIAKLECKIMVLKATVDTLNTQIDTLELFRPKVQVDIWKHRRAELKKEIKQLKIQLDLIKK